MKKIFLLAAATSLALTACDNNDDNQLSSGEALQITATIGESTVSRASDSDWNEGDKIGIISTIGGETRLYVNLPYTYTDTADSLKFTGTTIYYFKPMTLTAYYPFTGSAGTLPGENEDGVISVTTDANAQKNLPEIDFLWDSKTNKNQKDFSAANPKVNFVFSHKMSKVSFTFQDSPEIKNKDGIILAGPVNVEDMINYSIDGLGLDGTFDIITGECAVNEKINELAIDVQGEVKHNKPVCPLILFPQTLSDGYAVLHITTDELKDEKPENYQHYKCNLSFSNGEILPGHHYKYTIKVSKLGLIVGQMTVEPWKESVRSMTATIDGDVFKQNN